MKMGKSEINPFGMTTESSGTSGSDSEPEYATEMMPPPCDGKSCTSGEDEPMAAGEETERRTRRGGRYGPWRGRMHPMMFMMMMGGPRRGHGHPVPMGPPPAPFMTIGRSATPDCHGCPGRRRRQMKDDQPRRCHSAPGGRRGGPWGPACPYGGPHPSGPCMRRRFLRQMLRNPEFWQRMHEKFAETEDGGPLTEDDSDNETKKEVKCGKKCHGKREKRREMWQRFMQHMFEEMNLHASTESEEDECTEKENATKNETATDKKKVHFGDDEYFDGENSRPGDFPWMFPVRHGMRLRHGGPWVWPGYFGEMSMHGDPRMMMHGDPRMGHGEPRMMFGGRPRRCMFRHMMRNAASSEDEKSTSDREEKVNKRCQMREKREKFRRAVQEIGVRPWMFRMLAYQMYGKKAGSGDEGAQEVEILGKKTEKKERFLQILKELGAYPWMFRVLANQRARATAATGSESEGDCLPEGAKIADEGSPDTCRRRQRRKMFREMAKQMGWTSDSDGEAVIDGKNEGKEEEKQEEKERRKEERRRMREMMRGMGWMPWMMMGRPHHHHYNHHSADVENSDAEDYTTKSNKKPKVMQKEKREKVKQFRQAVNEMGVRPWMFRLLAREIYGKKNEAAASEDESTKKECKGKHQKKEKYLQTLRELGAYPWMFRVLTNQRAHTSATTGSESEGEAPLEGAAVEEGSPDRYKRGQRRKMFREMAKEMGWTSDSDGEALTDGEKEGKTDKKREERRRMREMMRRMGWMPWMMMTGHHHHHTYDGDQYSSEAEKSEQSVRKCEERRGKVKQFRQAVQEMGVLPWMFRLLAREMYGKPEDEDESAKEGKKGKKSEKKEKYLQIVRELGAYPWMFRVLANQRARAAATTGSESEGEAPLEGAAAAAEGSPIRRRRTQRRKMFREMAKQMGWTSDSDDEALTDGEKEGKSEQKQEERERRKEEKKRRREIMRGMGWMPWMMMGRHPHGDDHDDDDHLAQ